MRRRIAPSVPFPFLAAAALAAAPAPAPAQQGADAPWPVELRARATATAIVTDDVCGGLAGPGLGIELRSRGGLHAALALDVTTDHDRACIDYVADTGVMAGLPIEIRRQDDLEYLGLARLTGWLGGGGPVAVGVSAGAGLGAGVAFENAGGRAPHPWLGGRFEVELAERLAIGGEVGWVRVSTLTRYHLPDRTLEDPPEPRWNRTAAVSLSLLAPGRIGGIAGDGIILTPTTGMFDMDSPLRDCGGPVGSTWGIEARTRGTLFMAGTVDVFDGSGVLACNLPLREVPYDGGLAVMEESGGLRLRWNPRLGVHGGVTTPPFPVRAAARVGAGALLESTERRAVHPWLGGALELVAAELITAGVELGRTFVPVRRELHDADTDALLETRLEDEWVPTTSIWLGVRLPL